MHPVSQLVAICTRTEMEDFLREAACMKEFDHPNVMRLLGKLDSYWPARQHNSWFHIKKKHFPNEACIFAHFSK